VAHEKTREFERTYARLGKADAILSTAAAHHRLLWIYPFLDGNGGVSRFMSQAMPERSSMETSQIAS
jgi:Fic family protein